MNTVTVQKLDTIKGTWRVEGVSYLICVLSFVLILFVGVSGANSVKIRVGWTASTTCKAWNNTQKIRKFISPLLWSNKRLGNAVAQNTVNIQICQHLKTRPSCFRMAIFRTEFESSFWMQNGGQTIWKRDDLSSFRMVKTSLDPFMQKKIFLYV
jgi:hypothetical protein